MFHCSVYCHPLCSPTHLMSSVTDQQEAVKVCGKGGNGQELATDKISPDTPTSAPFKISPDTPTSAPFTSLGARSSRTRILRYWMLTQYLTTRMLRRTLPPQQLSWCGNHGPFDYVHKFKEKINKTKCLYGPSGCCRAKQISVILTVLLIHADSALDLPTKAIPVRGEYCQSRRRIPRCS
jgi:hypothetical protein